MVMVFGKITTKAIVDYEKVVRETCRNIGFTSGDVGIDADKCNVISHLYMEQGYEFVLMTCLPQPITALLNDDSHADSKASIRSLDFQNTLHHSLHTLPGLPKYASSPFLLTPSTNDLTVKNQAAAAATTTDDCGARRRRQPPMFSDRYFNRSLLATKPYLQSTQFDVNLLMTDYSMPGMTGFELLKKIKNSSTLRDIPIVIMSSKNSLTRIDRYDYNLSIS